MQFAEEYNDPDWIWDDIGFDSMAGVLAVTIAGASTYISRLVLRGLVAPQATSEADPFFE
jgi:hypothetical protein